jgi:hypothetical protein
MSLALYMDENVAGQITKGLRKRGIDVLTVQEDGRGGCPDPIVLDRATELGRVMFSQDRDVPDEAEYRQKEGIHFSGVIYAHQLHISIGTCVRDLEIIAQVGMLKEFISRIQYLPL